MSFTADKQTLDDLNLLGKFKQNSVFSLYNKVKTAGGEKLLSAMFQAPLTEHNAINKRSAIFKYFQQSKCSFPFSNYHFLLVENYLNGETGGNYISGLFSLAVKSLSGLLLKGEEYKNIQKGLAQTVALFTHFRQFISEIAVDGRQPFDDKLLTVKNILNDEKLEWMNGLHESADDLNLLNLARYDYLLRRKMREPLKEVMAIFYQLDVYIAVGKLAQEKGFNYAKALPGKHHILTATAMRHPMIEKAVANPVSFSKDSNLIFLTGANMAGKSTFMKAFGVNVYLAHMGFPVAVKQMEFSVKEGIYSSINVPDNLNMGLSHFYAEVLRVKKVAEDVSSDKGLVIIFDELFKGTNVKDAYDATLAVTAAFSEYRDCIFIISTHITEAGDVLAKQSNIQSLFLPTIMKGNVPTYTYHLQPGISNDRHGMMIIENEGILKLLE